MKHFTKTLALIFSAMLAGKSLAQVQTVTVQDSIFTNTHWTCDKQYLLKGYVYVVNGTTLTIDSGVIIRGDKNTKGSLIIERGAKIFATGTKYHPIVMTSDQPMGNRTYGDWGGIILCGKAPVNWTAGYGQVEGGPRSLYGGTDPHDNTGTITYMRVEFAGIAFSPNNEINGMTFCGVGDATQINHIQVSYSGDDSYEWFGGNVNTKYLIAYRGWDDDFDTDNGYSGKNQFGVGLRDPFAADQSGSKAFESDSYQAGTKTGLAGDTSGLTKCVFSNYTCIGGLVQPTSNSYDPQFVAAAHIRRGSAISIMNSILVGYPCGILVDESSASYGSTVRNMQQKGMAGDTICQIRNTVVAGIPTTNTPTRKEIEYVFDGARSLTPTNAEGDTITGTPFYPYSGPFNWLTATGATVTVPKTKNNMFPNEQSSLQLQSPFNLAVPNFVPNSTSKLTYNSAALPAYVVAHYSACCAQTDHFGNSNKYPFNTANPINTDTSNWFANYNAPAVWPSFSSGRLQNPFFTHVNYVGAFAGTQTTSDNWMAEWTNFDPVNTDYSTMVCAPTAIRNNFLQNTYLQAYPNPANESITVNFSVNEASSTSIEIYNIMGQRMDYLNLNGATAGLNSATINTKDLPEGTYFIKLTVNNQSKTTKFMVVK